MILPLVFSAVIASTLALPSTKFLTGIVPTSDAHYRPAVAAFPFPRPGIHYTMGAPVLTNDVQVYCIFLY